MKFNRPLKYFFLLLAFSCRAWAQPAGPKEYICHRMAGAINIDGRLQEPAWRNAPKTDLFVDIEGAAKPRPRFATQVRMLWDERYFYIASEMEEPHVWGTLTRRDSVIFHDNDFEVFIDPNGDRDEYYELEINALNTVWDLFLPKPYRDGGSARNEWDILGLKTAIRIDMHRPEMWGKVRFSTSVRAPLVR